MISWIEDLIREIHQIASEKTDDTVLDSSEDESKSEIVYKSAKQPFHELQFKKPKKQIKQSKPIYNPDWLNDIIEKKRKWIEE